MSGFPLPGFDESFRWARRGLVLVVFGIVASLFTLGVKGCISDRHYRQDVEQRDSARARSRRDKILARERHLEAQTTRAELQAARRVTDAKAAEARRAAASARTTADSAAALPVAMIALEVCLAERAPVNSMIESYDRAVVLALGAADLAGQADSLSQHIGQVDAGRAYRRGVKAGAVTLAAVLIVAKGAVILLKGRL